MRVAVMKNLADTAQKLLFHVGAAGLLTVMGVEAVAVIGRHTGLPLLGALEVAQGAIVPAACASMIIAALHGSHASVSLVSDRLPPVWRDRMSRTGFVVSSLFMLALFAGSCWLAHDFWNSFEQSEVLHIPFRPLRVLAAVSGGVLALIFLRGAVRARATP
jgi:TRAP-type C4-dicarboxylate transport system permease small subunit